MKHWILDRRFSMFDAWCMCVTTSMVQLHSYWWFLAIFPLATLSVALERHFDATGVK